VSLRAVPASVLAGPVPGVAETAVRVKASVRTMGPPWELHDMQGGDDILLLKGQESEAKALYHEIHRTKTMTHGDLYVCDSAGTRFTWDRKTFRWGARVLT
jgi:hypothetical protein